MYYIFNADGQCVCCCNYEPDVGDIGSRGEVAVYSEEQYDISKIKLIDGSIVEVEPEIPLETLKQRKLQEINDWTERNIVSGFISECTGAPVKYDSDKETQLTMQGIALNVNTELFAKKYPSGCPVRGYPEGSDVKQIFMLSPEQVMLWCADLSMHIGNCKVAGWEKQAAVEAAQSKDELDAIVLE